MFYIGETCKTLKERFKQHLNHILNFKPYKKYHDKEVPRHFRSNNHKLSDIKVCEFKSGLCIKHGPAFTYIKPGPGQFFFLKNQ